jgi:phytoene dehydrogenase-like protein
MPPTVDAVVIGAGHNGLVAANLLAEAGWDVVVCEAAPRPGGAVATEEVTVEGFRTDMFSAFYPLAAASPVINSLELRDHGLQWTKAPAVVSHVLPDGRTATLWQDPARTAASLDAFHPGDGAAWARLTTQWDRISADVIAAVTGPMPPIGAALRLLRSLGIGDTLRMARMALEPVRRFGEENFGGEGGPILFAGNALHADLPPEGAGSALYGWLLCMLGHSHGFPVPVGGADSIIHALVKRLESFGGQLRTQARVDTIEISAGRATGVVLASGERITARRAVLADVVAPTLFERLVGAEHLPPRFMDDLTKFQWDAPTLKIDWALRSKVPWSNPDAGQAGTVHLGVDMNGLTTYAADLARKRIPEDPFILFGQMTTSDPSRSPAGTESAWAYTHLPRGLDITTDDIERQVERVEDILEAAAPGFRSMVLGRYVQSPSDLQNSDANLVDGAVNGGTAQLHQQLVFRPVPGLAGAGTPIDRLYLAGSSAHPGGGVHGAPGANAAHAALSRYTVRGRAQRKLQGRLMNRIYREEG